MTTIWINDRFKRAAIAAERVPGAVRVELRSSGNQPTVIVLPHAEANRLAQQITDAMQPRGGTR